MTVAAYAIIYLVWGSTYLAISVAVQSIPPLLMMGLRCSAAGLLLLAWAAIRGARANVRQWTHAAIAGALMFAVPYGALAWAEQRIPSGVAALLSATSPFWLTAFEWSQGRRPSGRTIAGLAVGLAGVFVLVGRGAGGTLDAAGIVAILGSAASWAAGSLYARRSHMPRSVALSAGMSLVSGGALLLMGSWSARELAHFTIGQVSSISSVALAYLVVFGSLVGFTAYSWLMRAAPASRVATHAYVNPLVAMALGSAIAGEQFTATIGVGGCVIATGVAIALAGRAHA